MPDAVGEPADLEQLGERRKRAALNDVGRRFEGKRAQDVGDRLEPRVVCVHALGVARGELGDFLLGAAAADLEVAPVVEGEKIGDFPLDDAQPVRAEIEIADDLRIEQRDRVGRNRVAKAGVEFLRDGGAADHRPPLEHGDIEARHRQVGGTGEAIVPAADDRHVVHCRPYGKD